MRQDSDKFYKVFRTVVCCCWLAVFPFGMFAQEDVKRVAADSVRTGEAGKASSLSVSADKEVPLPGKAEFSSPSSASKLSDSDSLWHLSLEKPLALPYYIAPSSLLRGDYVTEGVLGAWKNGMLHASGHQTTLPGIGIMNEASLEYVYRFNSRWSMQLGVDALKMNIPFAVEQSLGTSGSLMYCLSDRVTLKVFGSYYSGPSYGMRSAGYGGSLMVGMSERFSMEVGVRRLYNPLRGGWETVPIAAPCYKFNKFDLGIDLGGLLYEILHKVVIDKDRMKMGNPTIGPPPPM